MSLIYNYCLFSVTNIEIFITYSGNRYIRSRGTGAEIPVLSVCGTLHYRISTQPVTVHRMIPSRIPKLSYSRIQPHNPSFYHRDRMRAGFSFSREKSGNPVPGPGRTAAISTRWGEPPNACCHPCPGGEIRTAGAPCFRPPLSLTSDAGNLHPLSDFPATDYQELAD
jgi:hypothetical protein